MSTEMIANSDNTQREKCAGVDFLSHTCVVCDRDFEPRQHNQVTCGALGCRFGRQRRQIRAAEHAAHDERQWGRRRAKSLIDLMLQTRGTQGRDKYTEQQKLVKDKTQVHARCKQCGKDFVDANNNPITSSFEFCGESLLIQGECKLAWLASLPAPAPAVTAVVISQPLDEERLANTKRVHAPKAVHLGRRKLNFCPQCREYVNQDHEHGI